MSNNEVSKAIPLKAAIDQMRTRQHYAVPGPLNGEDPIEARFATYSPAHLVIININRFMKRDEQSIPETYRLNGALDIGEKTTGEELADMLIAMPSDIYARDKQFVILSQQKRDEEDYWKIFYSVNPSFRRHVMVHIEGSKNRPKVSHVVFVEEEGQVDIDPSIGLGDNKLESTKDLNFSASNFRIAD